MCGCYLNRIFFCFILNVCAVAALAQEFGPSSPQEATQISNLNIKAFCQDSLGNMWIATPHGLNRYNGYEFVQYFHDPLDSNSIGDDYVRALFLDSSNRLWVGTTTGVDRYNFETNSFEHYSNGKDKPYYSVFSFFEDHQKNIWVVTAPGAVIIDTVKCRLIHQESVGQKFVNLFWEDNSHRLWMGLYQGNGLAVQRDKNNWDYFSLPGDRSVHCRYQDQQGMWWLGTNEGIVLFDPVLQVFKNPPGPVKDDRLLNHTKVNFIKEVSPLKLLIGTDSQGLFLYDIPRRTLLHNELNQRTKTLSSQLLSCYIDRDHNVWFGSFDKGFKVWNRCLDYFNSDKQLSDTFKDMFVDQIAEDAYGNLWVGTRYDGIFHYSSSGKVTVYNTQNSDLFPNDENLIESVFVDSHDRIWIGLTNYLVVAKISRDGHLQKLETKNFKWVGFMTEDHYGNLWLGSFAGLFRIKMDDPGLNPELIKEGNSPYICILKSGDVLFSSFGNGIFLLRPNEKVPVPFLPGDSVSNKRGCISICEDTQHRIWMGSYRGGLLCVSPDRKHYHVFSKRQGLPSDDILRIEEGNHGDMWVSTSFGISKLRMADTTFVNYFNGDGTLGNQFHEKAGLKHSDGRIFFTGNHGLTFFDPMVDMPPKFQPKVHLTDLKIFNQSVVPASSGSVLTQTLPYTRQITLNHRQTVISIDYTGIDFLYPNKLKYAYQLEGFDKNWNLVGNYRRATYSNLSPGKYLFKVKAINGDGIESQTPATLTIIVKPAPWFSWQAWTAYFLIAVAAVYWIFRLVLNMRLQRHRQEAEHREREREKEINEMKMNFFTNISHEIRTPLTLISAPLEQLSSSQKLDEQGKNLLGTISRNVQSMLRLINQLLDFRKMESGMLKIQVQQIDAIQFIRNIQEIFFYSAMGKQIKLDFVPHVPSFPLWMDADKVEEILYNLLSNAVKFTPARGMISVITRELGPEEADKKYQVKEHSYLEVIVADNGPGVPADKLHELFVRYRQIEGPSGRKPDYGGSGIGLYYTKRLVETHHGKILAQIRQEGGMAFSFILPLGDVYPQPDKQTQKINLPVKTSLPEQPPKTEGKNKNEYTILVAEDNPELMTFIRNLLNNQFHVIEAMDGSTAWEMVQRDSLDLILSDVLMPGLTGYELCRNVKQHPEFSHIPVVLLTAKSTLNDQLEGLEQGADAYICKPFNIDYLLLTIKNLFLSRDRLRQYYSMPQVQDQKNPPVSLNVHDQKFMAKLTQILEKELANPNLDIDTIARDLGFSRTGFYRKVKGLSDMSPSDFVRSYRLRRAAELLQENTMSLNDIATYTGFNFYSHFSKSFKKQFGVSPKDYIQT